MVIFFPFSVTSAVPGGLGRWLLSCAGCAMARAPRTSIMTGTPTAKYFCRIFYVSFRDKASYDRPGGGVMPGPAGAGLPHDCREVTKGQCTALYQVILSIIPSVT